MNKIEHLREEKKKLVLNRNILFAIFIVNMLIGILYTLNGDYLWFLVSAIASIAFLTFSMGAQLKANELQDEIWYIKSEESVERHKGEQ